MKKKKEAMTRLGKSAEITRFKGLGEISPDEFGQFINENIRLDPVRLSESGNIHEMLKYFMGKNTQQRQEFIIDNLRSEAPLEEEL